MSPRTHAAKTLLPLALLALAPSAFACGGDPTLGGPFMLLTPFFAWIASGMSLLTGGLAACFVLTVGSVLFQGFRELFESVTQARPMAFRGYPAGEPESLSPDYSAYGY